MKVSLVVVTAAKTAGQTIPIKLPQFIIGRDPQCHLRPSNALISKRHCAILIKKNSVFLRDFDSTNGTFLNGQPVKGEVPVQNGDLLRVGPLQFRFQLEIPAVSVDKPTPLPAVPDAAPGGEEDLDNLLLGLGDDADTLHEGSQPKEVPPGTTITEMPPINPDAPAEAETKPKAPEKKAAPVAETARDAARAILEKYAKRNR